MACLALSALTLATTGAPALGQLSPSLPPVTARQHAADTLANSQELQLDVLIRGEPQKLIGAFRKDSQGRLVATVRELNALGLRTPAGVAPNAEIPLTALPGLRFNYDESQQRIDFDITDEGRLPRVYDLSPRSQRTTPAPPNLGFVLNYSAFTSAGLQGDVNNFLLEGSSVSLDARLSTPVGVFSQSGFVTTNRFDGASTAFRRLDTAWMYTDVDRAITWRAGDLISGGFAWTRPIRIGGLQAQRDFAVRPDILTIPLPGASGVALAPSVVDVYVNGYQAASRQIGSGPYQISNIPAGVGQGETRVVVRDATGKVVETASPFYTTGRLMRQGLWSFSLEGGFPRLGFGSFSTDYERNPVGSASVTLGLTDTLTLQAHAEGARGFAGGGIGMVAAPVGRILLGAAFSASYHRGKLGYQGYVSAETRLANVTLSASALRSFATYADLASVTARPGEYAAYPELVGPGGVLISARPVRAQYSASVSAPLGILDLNANLGFVHYRALGGKASDIVTAGLSAPLPWRGSLHVSGWGDVRNRRNAGIVAGLTIPLGPDTSAIASVGRESSGVFGAVQAAKYVKREPGSYGWRILDREGAQRTRIASGAYRSAHGQAELTVGQVGNRAYGSAQIDGALVIAGGDVFFTNRIDDAYAIIDAGAPGVPVTYENRPAGVTNARGRALIPTLQPWTVNRIGIDPTNLPLNAVVTETQETVTPRARSGVVVKFGVQTNARSATVILTDGAGKPLPAGVTGRSAAGESLVVGYDGQAFITNLADTNEVTVDTPEGICVARFNAAPSAEGSQTIGPVPCQTAP